MTIKKYDGWTGAGKKKVTPIGQQVYKRLKELADSIPKAAKQLWESPPPAKKYMSTAGANPNIKFVPKKTSMGASGSWTGPTIPTKKKYPTPITPSKPAPDKKRKYAIPAPLPRPSSPGKRK